MTASSRFLVAILFVFGVQGDLISGETPDAFPHLVPQRLLGLVHAPEVHQELKLSAEQVEDLEKLLRELDLKWFPSRNLSPQEQHPVVHDLERKVWEWFGKSTSESQRQRLQQLEYYAQGTRLLLRRDVASKIKLFTSQQQKLAELARVTDEAQIALGRTLAGDPQIKSLQAKVDKAAKSERDGIAKMLRPEQQQQLRSLLGDPFDPTRLRRIYALAPEFVPVQHWINSGPLTMQELRGKVVLVHFYAFQCHNCHANFPIYQRWQKELTGKGVVLIGIQTPETKRERDTDAVTNAARERELTFPILIDLNSANWDAWGNTMWPCVYLVDKQGYIRMWWAGELNWKGATADKTIEAAVEALLKEE
ncbi:redoxin domain-containing protein [Schlesneria sp.]|uniref:redoxin domain-containing protein n=1 Tax=Schlesneria sp. TaxID=2762018 RepID=UPI002EFF1F0E